MRYASFDVSGASAGGGRSKRVLHWDPVTVMVTRNINGEVHTEFTSKKSDRREQVSKLVFGGLTVLLANIAHVCLTQLVRIALPTSLQVVSSEARPSCAILMALHQIWHVSAEAVPSVPSSSKTTGSGFSVGLEWVSMTERIRHSEYCLRQSMVHLGRDEAVYRPVVSAQLPQSRVPRQLHEL